MRRRNLTLLLAGLSWLSLACGGRSNEGTHGGALAGAAGAAGGLNSTGATANGGPVVMGGAAATRGEEGPGAVPSGGVGSSSTSAGGDIAGGSAGLAAAGGRTGDAGAGAGGMGDSERSAFALNARAALNGFLFLATCLIPQDTRVCYVRTAFCPRDDDPTLSGLLMTDQTFQLGGDPAVTYELTLHVQGLTEAKAYKGGVDQSSSNEQNPADGLYTGGAPDPGTARSVYMIRVGEPARDYFLNSIATESDTRSRYSVFPVDYLAKIRIQGGTTLRLIASDPNCGISRNCADSESTSECKPLSLANIEPVVAQQLGPQPYDGQFLGLAVVDVALVQ